MQIARWGEDYHAFGIQDEFFLAIGCKLCHVWTEREFVNSALDMVNDILYGPGLKPLGFPQVVMVEFDDYHKQYLAERLFAVKPISKSCRQNAHELSCL